MTFDNEDRSFSDKESLERIKPNLLRDFNACVDVVMEIEKMMGNIDRQTRDAIEQGMSLAVEQYSQKDMAEMSAEERKNFKQDRRVSGFQGVDGFNRYSVCGDGSILMSGSHSTERCRKKARELGIDTPEFI